MLGQRQSSQLVQYLGSLFPRWKTNPDLVAFWVTRLSRFRVSIEQATAVAEQHRASRKGSDPDLATIEEAMREAQQDNRPTVSESRMLPGRTGEYVDNGPTGPERCERYAEGGIDLWVRDGFDAKWWPVMEECIQDWQKGKRVNNWTLIVKGLRGSGVGRPSKRDKREGGAA